MSNTVKVENIYGDIIEVDRFSGEIVTAQQEIPDHMRHIATFNPDTLPKDDTELVNIAYTGFWVKPKYVSPVTT